MKKHPVILSVAAVLAILGIWEIVATVIGTEMVLPKFSAVMWALWGLVREADFYATVGATLLRCLVSFVIAFVVGATLGIIAGRLAAVGAALRPIIAAMRTIPTLALVLILMLTFGSQAAPIVIGILLVLPVVYQTVKTAVENVDSHLIELAMLDGASEATLTRCVVVPLAMPYLWGTVSTTFGLSIKGVISAEILAYTAVSIGHAMKFASMDSLLSSMPELFAWVLVALALSAVSEFILKTFFRVTKRLLKFNV